MAVRLLDGSRRNFLRTGLTSVGGLFTVGPASAKLLGHSNHHGGSGFEVLNVLPVAVPEALLSKIQLAGSYFSKLGFELPLHSAQRITVRAGTEIYEFIEYKSRSDEMHGRVAGLMGVSDGNGATLMGALASHAGGRTVRLEFSAPARESFSRVGVVEIHDGEPRFTEEPGLNLSDKQRKSFVTAFEFTRQAEVAPRETGILCNPCRTVITAMKDAGCIYSAAVCAGCCAANVVCPACILCATVTYQLCFGETTSNMGCKFCTLVNACACPCGSYC